MKKLLAAVVVLVVLAMALTACGPKETPAPANTPRPTKVPPTTTPLAPTNTPVPPTATPLPGATLAAEPVRVAEAGFSISYPEGWQTLILGPAVLIYESEAAMQAEVPTGTIVAALAGPLQDISSGSAAEAKTSEEILSVLFGSLVDAPDVKQGPVEKVTVGGQEGAASDFTATMEDTPVGGRLVAVHLGDRGALFYALGTVEDWQAFRSTFNTMLASVTFFPPEVPTVEPEPTSGPGPTSEPEPTSGPAPTLTGGPPEGFIWRIGGEGTLEDGQYAGLGGIDYGPDGNLYVADSWNGVFVISTDGDVLGTFGGQMNSASDLKVGPDSNIYVAAPGDQAIYVFSPEGDASREPLRKWGELGQDEGEFGLSSPRYLAVCDDGLVYAADQNEDDEGNSYERVEVFDAEGNFQAQWNITDIDDSFEIAGMDCAADGNIYLSGFLGDYVMVLDAQGTHVNDLGGDALSPDGAQAIYVHPSGAFYVGTWIGWVGAFDPEGGLMLKWGVPFEGAGDQAPGQLYNVAGVTLDSDNNVYITHGTNGFTYLTKFVFP